jgi:hypothetical protein
MKRSVLSLAAAVGLAVGGALLGVAGPASAASADDTATVCSRVSNYNTPLRDALNTQADAINSQTQSGDTNAATATAKQLGTTVQTWVGQVQLAAGTASDTNLKTALTTAATDASQLSQQLMTYDGSQQISLDQFATDNMKINTLCGFTTMAPSPSSS